MAENRTIIDRHRLTAVPVQTIADIEADPHWRERELTIDAADADGSVRMHRVVPRLSETPGAIRWPGPALGADNERIYGEELGLAPAEIARLRADGVI